MRKIYYSSRFDGKKMLFQKIKICYVIISAVNVRTGACAYMDATGLLDATLLA